MSETDKTFYSIGCYKTILINAQLMSGARDPFLYTVLTEQTFNSYFMGFEWMKIGFLHR